MPRFRPRVTLLRLMAGLATAILGSWIWAGFFADPLRDEGLVLYLLFGSCFGLMMLPLCALVFIAMIASPSDPPPTVRQPLQWPRFTIGQLMIVVAMAAVALGVILWHP